MEAALAAHDFGADLIGFVFAPSRRRITLAEARKIAYRISNIGKVGVFVNAPLTEVREAASACKLDYVQLHGDESPEYCRLVGYPVIKAFRIAPGFSSNAFNGYQTAWTLFDSFSAGEQGGTGMAFDWQAAQALTRQAPRPLMAAGGLTPENVVQAVEVLKPNGVDVSGGVETKGIKDIEKIKRFIMAAKGG